MASSSLYKLVAASLSLIIFLALLLLRLQIHCPLSFRDPKLFPLLSLCACHLKIFSPGLPMTDTFSLFQTHSPVRVMSCFLRSTSAAEIITFVYLYCVSFPQAPHPQKVNTTYGQRLLYYITLGTRWTPNSHWANQTVHCRDDIIKRPRPLTCGWQLCTHTCKSYLCEAVFYT